MIPALPSTRFKIFIVDDSPIVVERLTLMLNDLDQVSVAGHADSIATALISIKEIRPDVVLLDIHLKEDAPDANGIDLLIMLREAYPVMHIMMITNHTHPHYIKKCMELGANSFFDKSNDFDKIPETIKKIYESK